MTVADILRQSALSTLDTEVLLAHALHQKKEWLITHPDYLLNKVEQSTWSKYEQRRKNYEPVAYIVGYKEFYGRDFTVNTDVLIPRPTTESVIDSVKTFLSTGINSCVDTDTDIVASCHALGDVSTAKHILDLGTGSGCIAITLQLELPTYTVYASDISTGALEVAKQNAEQLHADVTFVQADGAAAFDVITEPFVLVSNPPYIPKTEQLEPNVMQYEPHQALFSGARGIDLLQSIVHAAKAYPQCVGICLECKKAQWQELEKIL